jgi:hypothetical protein
MNRSTRATVGIFAGLVFAALAPTAYGGAHTWDVVEVFSNADGTIQFVELRETGGGDNERNLNGLKVISNDTGNQFTFPANLVGTTGLRSILLGTTAYAALPGAPAPDHIIPANFFDITGDFVEYHVYDDWVFGAVPTDGVMSMNRVGGSLTNSPKNYAGVTGTVDASEVPGDFDGDGDVDLIDYNQYADCLAGPDAAPNPQNGGVNAQDCLDAFDLTGDLDVDLEDFADFQRRFDIP